MKWEMVAVIVALVLAGGDIIATNWHLLDRAESGIWADKEVDNIYRADTDGFVVVTSRGNNPKTAEIYEGSTREILENATNRRTRISKYGSATLPIQKGRYWKVKAKGSGDSLSVLWTPMP